MRLRLRDGDHIRVRRLALFAPVRLQCGSVSGTEITGSIHHHANASLQAAMRLRLRDGDHWPSSSGSTSCRRWAAMRLRLRDGDHAVPGHPDRRVRLCCNAAPSQGRRSLLRGDLHSAHAVEAAMRLRLRDGDHHKVRNLCTTAHYAAMRLRLRDGDHWGGRPRRWPHRTSRLQCGSVSGTEITVDAVFAHLRLLVCCNAAPSQGRRSPGDARVSGDARVFGLQCGSVSGTEITLRPRASPTRPVLAAMRLRLRDGDHLVTAGLWSPAPGCNAAPSQGRRSHRSSRHLRVPLDDAAMRLRLRDGDHHRHHLETGCKL